MRKLHARTEVTRRDLNLLPVVQIASQRSTDHLGLDILLDYGRQTGSSQASQELKRAEEAGKPV